MLCLHQASITMTLSDARSANGDTAATRDRCPQHSTMDVDPTITSLVAEGFDDHVVDVISVMRLQERTSYMRSDYLQTQQLKHVLDGSWRQRIVEWMYGVVDHCSLRRGSVATATYYLDLCVERGLIKSREEFQLAAMTALQIAIKLCDSTVVKLQSMVALGRGLFTEEDVINMESKMLSTLNWMMHPPTPVCFLRQFLRLLPPSISNMTRYMLAEVTRFISEISVCLYKFVKYPPSVIAYSGMLIAMKRFDDRALPAQRRKEIFSAMSTGAGMDCSSPLVVEAVASLQLSLEKNASLQELMNTIDAQCSEGTGVSKMRSSDFGNASPSGGCLSSPRDVMTRH